MTTDQHIASDPAISAWVSASAGTGKTKVLTDRVLRLLLAGAEPAKILCITYTRAASAEMEGRISQELSRWVTASDDTLQASLLQLTGRPAGEKTMARARTLFALVLDAAPRLRIETIHGFCQSILTRFPLEAGVPPHFTPIDDLTARELLTEARMQLFFDAGESHNHVLAHALAELGAHIGETALYELIEQIIRQRRKFSEWFSRSTNELRIYEALGLAPGTDEEKLARKHLHYTTEEKRLLRQACEVLAQGKGDSDQRMYDALRNWLEKPDDAKKYYNAFITDKGTPRMVLSTKACTTAWPPLTEVLAAEQLRMLSWYGEYQSLQIARFSGQIAVLARAMLERYHRLKTRHAYLDYDDLILYAVELLHSPGIAPWVLYKLDGGIDHLLIDEAQDTAPDQWRIALALAEEFFAGEGARSLKRTFFVVGDEKQSIYSFQGADPREFDKVQRRLSRLISDSGMEYRRVQLALSFRSTAPVLQAIDAVFLREEARNGLIFGETDIRHEVSRKGSAGRVELWPLVEAENEEALPAWHVTDKPFYTKKPILRCAELIATQIASWLQEGRILASKGRTIKPGDIMILVQRRGAFADTLLRALKRRKIAVAGADRLLLTEHIAVMDCMALARFLLLPQDDLTLAEVLRSPLGGLSEEELFELSNDRGSKPLWQRLKENLAYGEAHAFLSDMLARTDYMPPYELFAYMLETQGGRRKLAARLGEEIADPLNEFLSLALEYSQSHPPSLEGYVHWLQSGEIEIKRDMEKGKDEVRILTVHGAKGLQAPIVFLPDTTRMPLFETGILWKDTPPVPLWSPAKDSDDTHYRALRETGNIERKREYRRLLYVAMTRAEDELYVCGWKNSKAVAEDCWYELVRHAASEWAETDGKRVLVSQQLAATPAQPERAASIPISNLPPWALKEAAAEPVPSRPLAPSRLAEVPDALPPSENTVFERGQLVHRLLQYLPEAVAGERKKVMEQFFVRYGRSLSPEEKEEISAEVLAILNHPEFAPVFGPGSIAEASIAGVTGETPPVTISGRIDRLAVLDKDVYIVDYKTGRRMPQDESHVPASYLRQMEAYGDLVRKIYPEKTVHCAILWTSGPKLMALSQALLQHKAA